MYCDIVSVCKKYNLCILLGGGSALGSVRHKGFIPWDDDIDLIMPRKDYNKLLDVIEKELGDKCHFLSPYTFPRKYFILTIIKKNTIMKTFNDSTNDVSGIKIDIFPIEKTPDNRVIRYFMGKSVTVLQILIKCVEKYNENNNTLKKIMSRTIKGFIAYRVIYYVGFLFSVISLKKWYKFFERFVSSGKGTKYVTIPTGRKDYFGEMLPVNVFFPPAKGMFEGMEVNLPHDFDTYLSNLYGNYMEIPPVEKREMHDCLAFSLDTTK
jgi:lipopolysaccharide cholinephosphotransferase